MKKTWRIKPFRKNKVLRRARLVCFFALLGVSILNAKDLPAYHVGEVAEENIIAPVALDVIDPVATAALKSDEALKTPAIFRSYSDTNAIADEFLAAFADARKNFITAVQDTFHQTTIDAKTIASPDFGYLITAFNIKNRNFPVTDDLAATWARGDSGLTAQNKLLGPLLELAQVPTRPDDLPAGFVIGETLRLVPVKNPDEKLLVSDTGQRGQFIATSNLTTISGVRANFRRGFSPDEQPLARALSEWLKPNCLPDAELTQLARDRATRQLVVGEHYDAGQIIVRRGAAIDPKAKIALDQLAEKPIPDSFNQMANIPAPSELAQTLPTKKIAQPATGVLSKISAKTTGPQNHALKISPANICLFVALIILAITLFGLWRFFSQRQPTMTLPARVGDLLPQNQVTLQTELAPYLVQAVKEALVQELAVQRRELIFAQQQAAIEIAELVRRLDELQMPMQERLHAYELQIQRLERELAERNAENRELLKLKIEMTRQQLEVERERNRPEFN